MLTFLYSSDFFLLQFYNELLNEAILNAYSNPLMAGLFEKHLELYKFLICEQQTKQDSFKVLETLFTLLLRNHLLVSHH